jgi:hypothetical protein
VCPTGPDDPTDERWLEPALRIPPSNSFSRENTAGRRPWRLARANKSGHEDGWFAGGDVWRRTRSMTSAVTRRGFGFGLVVPSD